MLPVVYHQTLHEISHRENRSALIACSTSVLIAPEQMTKLILRRNENNFSTSKASSHFGQKHITGDMLLLRYNGSYTMMAKPMKTLELHYPMTQFLISSNSFKLRSNISLSPMLKTYDVINSMNNRKRALIYSWFLARDRSRHMSARLNKGHAQFNTRPRL